MTNTMAPCCGNCVHAEWREQGASRCKAIPIVTRPEMVVADVRSLPITPNDGKACTFWHATGSPGIYRREYQELEEQVLRCIENAGDAGISKRRIAKALGWRMDIVRTCLFRLRAVGGRTQCVRRIYIGAWAVRSETNNPNRYAVYMRGDKDDAIYDIKTTVEEPEDPRPAAEFTPRRDIAASWL